jgi:hypothetical protein
MNSDSYDLTLSAVAGSLIVVITICFAAAVTVAQAASSDASLRPGARLRALERQLWMFFPFAMLTLAFFLLTLRALGSPPRAAAVVFMMVLAICSLGSFIWLALMVYMSLNKPAHHGGASA